jgi:hypothetical protein
MKKTKLSIATFGAILGIAGIEHGVGEILQGNIIPGNMFIKSWPNDKLYNILAGEPAFTILTGFPIYITGFIAIIVSTLIIILSMFFLEKKYSRFIFPALIISLFLFGGGMAGPVLMGILLSWATFRIYPEVNLFKKKKPIWELLKSIWKFVYPVSILSWLSLWPGLVLIGAIGIIPNASIVYVLSLISLITFILTIFSACAYDTLNNLEPINE